MIVFSRAAADINLKVARLVDITAIFRWFNTRVMAKDRPGVLVKYLLIL